MNSQKRGPSGLWYLLPVCLAIGALALVPAAAVKAALAKADVAVQFKAPGTAEVEIPRPGTYTLWLETKTIFEGTTYELGSTLPPGMKFELVDLNTKGTLIPFVPQSGSQTMTSGSVQRESVGSFEVTDPGRYRVSVTGQFPEKIFYLRESLMRQFRVVLHAVAVASLMGLLAVGLAVIIFLRQRAARQVI